MRSASRPAIVVPDRRGRTDDPGLGARQRPRLAHLGQQEGDDRAVETVEGVAETADQQEQVVRTTQRQPVEALQEVHEHSSGGA
jgi:hypothetical protein